MEIGEYTPEEYRYLYLWVDMKSLLEIRHPRYNLLSDEDFLREFRALLDEAGYRERRRFRGQEVYDREGDREKDIVVFREEDKESIVYLRTRPMRTRKALTMYSDRERNCPKDTEEALKYRQRFNWEVSVFEVRERGAVVLEQAFRDIDPLVNRHEH